jgi:Bifunctional DNA primase/polymerase, N-terminal
MATSFFSSIREKTMREPGPFIDWALIYREMGCWPRRITPGTKACHDTAWQKGDHELPPQRLEGWIDTGRSAGIGLLMGSPFEDGTRLGALDIDSDPYVPLGRALLKNPPCGRIGKKGAVFFVRTIGRKINAEFRVKGDEHAHLGKVAECLFHRKLCVIPPTIHPDTKCPYRWIGIPLHEVNFRDLPIVEL